MSAEYIAYHDQEWGVPVHDDRRLFEFLILEGAQAGLSWSTILRKREGYRESFADFDPVQVAKFDARKVEKLLQFPGIVRNRLKVAAAITNARCFLEVQEEFGSFAEYSWQFVGGLAATGHDAPRGSVRLPGAGILWHDRGCPSDDLQPAAAGAAQGRRGGLAGGP